jgi:hypothetical protein
VGVRAFADVLPRNLRACILHSPARPHLWHHSACTSTGKTQRRKNDAPLFPCFSNESSGVIVYNLGCVNDHQFEGWFASAADYERQSESRVLTCPLCGSENVSRRAHAPYVSTGAIQRQEPQPHATPSAGPPMQYSNLTAELVSNVVEKLLEHTVDVGRAFPEEARKIHYKEAPERAIRGTASAQEVDALRDEGIQVMTLPLPAHRLIKTH